MHRATSLALATAALAAATSVPAAAAQTATPYPQTERPHATVTLREAAGIAARTLDVTVFHRSTRLGVDVRVAARAARPGGGPVRGVLRVAPCPDAGGSWRFRRCPEAEARTVALDGRTDRFERFSVVARGAVQAVQVTFDPLRKELPSLSRDTPALVLVPGSAWHQASSANAGARLVDVPRANVTELHADLAGVDDTRARATFRWKVRAREAALTRWQWCGGPQVCAAARALPLRAGAVEELRRRPSVRGQALRLAAWADPTPAAPDVVEHLYAANLPRPVL